MTGRTFGPKGPGSTKGSGAKGPGAKGPGPKSYEANRTAADRQGTNSSGTNSSGTNSSGSNRPGARNPVANHAPAKGGDSSAPFSRPVPVSDLPPQGLEVTIEANEAERAGLAKLLGLPSLERLTATYRLFGRGRAVHVEGELSADLQQTCVVTLEPFPVSVREPVDVRFSEEVAPTTDEVVELSEQALDAPEPLVNGVIDIGALAGEFLALALDPYPRKPGAEFSFEGGGPAESSPFAVLSGLKTKSEPNDG